MPEIITTLVQLFSVIGTLLYQLFALSLHISLLLFWLAWALLGINWKKMWPTLAAGAWMPLALLVVLGALVWANLFPTTHVNFWWQLGAAGSVAAATLFCGWLQGVLNWSPAEIDLGPAATGELHE